MVTLECSKRGDNPNGNNRGFIEIFNRTTGNWKTINTKPPLNFPDDKCWFQSAYLRPFVQVCEYSMGYIVVLFSADWDCGLDRKFYIYNTVKDVWSTSDTEAKVEAYQQVSAMFEHV